MLKEIEKVGGNRIFAGSNGKIYRIYTGQGFDDPTCKEWEECNTLPRPRHLFEEMKLKEDNELYPAKPGEWFWTYTEAYSHMEAVDKSNS